MSDDKEREAVIIDLIGEESDIETCFEYAIDEIIHLRQEKGLNAIMLAQAVNRAATASEMYSLLITAQGVVQGYIEIADKFKQEIPTTRQFAENIKTILAKAKGES